MSPEERLMPPVPGVYKRLIDRQDHTFRKNEKGTDYPIPQPSFAFGNGVVRPLIGVTN